MIGRYMGLPRTITVHFALLHWLANMDYFLQQARKPRNRGKAAFPHLSGTLV
jgi:hypothetical protein